MAPEFAGAISSERDSSSRSSKKTVAVGVKWQIAPSPFLSLSPGAYFAWVVVVTHSRGFSESAAALSVRVHAAKVDSCTHCKKTEKKD